MGVSSESTSISLLQIVRIIMIDVSLNVYVKKNRYHNMNHASSSSLKFFLNLNIVMIEIVFNVKRRGVEMVTNVGCSGA